MSTILTLISVFTQIAICAFGGGLATLPLIEYQLIVKTGWLTESDFAQILALSQVTPGPIAINAATFSGFQQAGVYGSIVSTATMVIVPMTILSLTLHALKNVSDEKNKKFKQYLRPLVSGLLTLSLLSPLKVTLNNGYRAIILFLIGLLLVNYVKFVREHTPYMLIAFGIIGILYL